MFEGKYFYHKAIRRSISIFGSLFNEISIENVDQKTGKVIKRSRVPIGYGPKEKFLERIDRSEERELINKQDIAIQMPRLSFQITGFQYKPDVSVSKYQKYTHKCVTDPSDPGASEVWVTYAPVPYLVNMELNILSRSQDELFQILEQILPYFRPDITVTVRSFDEADSTWDLPIVLESVGPSDDYEGIFEQRRVLIYTLTFSMIVRLYGPVTKSGIIRKVTADVLDNDGAGGERIEVKVDPASSPHDGTYNILESTTSLFYTDNL